MIGYVKGLKLFEILLMLMVIMLVTPSTSAFFWTDQPLNFGYDDDPAEIPATPDGTGTAIVSQSQGTCYAQLDGGTEESPADIYYTEAVEGLSLMFCVAYDIEARMKDPYDDTMCVARLTLLHFEDPEWVEADTMAASVQTLYPAIEENMDEGWLYVWMDVDYTEEPRFKLTLDTYTKYWNGYEFINFGNSPQSVSVYFDVIDQT